MIRATEPDLWRKFHSDIRDARLIGQRRQIVEDAARDYAYLRVALDRVERATERSALDADTLVVNISEAVKRVALSHGIRPTEFLDAIRAEYLAATPSEAGK